MCRVFLCLSGLVGLFNVPHSYHFLLKPIFRCTFAILTPTSAVELVLVLEQNGIKYSLPLQVTLLSFIRKP